MKKYVFLFMVMIATVAITSSFVLLPSAEAYYSSGVQKIKSRKYMEAIGDFTKAISLKNNYGSAYYQRARAKELLAKQYGFQNTELCYDLTQAMKYGSNKASEKIQKTCMGECHSNSSPVFKSEPNIILCADMSFKSLTNLPAGSEKMSNCVKLNFMGNKTTTLSSNIGKLKSLVVLDLSSNKLTSMTSAIGQLTHLEELNLSKNMLKTLPTEFGNLKSVKKLYLRNNQINQLPASISKLSNLEELDLSVNQLKNLPLHIVALKKLKKLSLVGNQIKKKERENIKALLPHTTIYFE